MPGIATSIATGQKRAPLVGRNIGLSISDNHDRAARGFDRIHQNTFMYEVARMLYRSGASVSYGGHLRNEGFTAASLQHLIDERQESLEHQSIHSYVAWPLYCRELSPQDRLQGDFLKFAEIVELPSPHDFSGPKDKFLDPTPVPNRYYWFRSLTALRHKMNSEIHARVILGGKLNGFIGRYPGIVEEALFAISTHKPLYICGGFGGAALGLAELFRGRKVPALDSCFQFCDEQYVVSVNYYETALAVNLQQGLGKATTYDRFVEYAVDYGLLCDFFREVGIGGLANGLSSQENEILFESNSLDEIQSLVLTGLTRLFSNSREQNQSWNESASIPGTAFSRVIQGANRPRSPLIDNLRQSELISADELLSMESELFSIFGEGYRDAREMALRPCLPTALEGLDSISKGRSLISLDLAALNWLPARGDISRIAEFLKELYKVNPCVSECETFRRHLSTGGVELSSLNRTMSRAPILEVTTMRIDGPEQGKLSTAIQRAFPSPKLLRDALKTQLDDDIWNYAGLDDEYPDIRSKMISAYGARDKIANLVSALLNENPSNSDLVEFAWRHQVLKRPAGGAGRATPDDGTLERMLDPVRGFTDVGQMLQRISQVVNSVCQITYPVPGGISYGTGFLIGNSTLLTNWHVMESVTAANWADVSLRFDYRTGLDGVTLSPGVEFRLCDGKNWLIDHSPYDPADTQLRSIDDEKALDRSLENLDYAVLRLAGEPGKFPIGNKASENAQPRGYLSLDDAIEMPTDLQSAIWCFQHPYENGESLPQQVDWNKPGLLGSNPNKSRVWYDINTRPGSSGSPILANKMQLCALHHAGGKEWPAAASHLYNRGIPLAAIRDLLTKRGKRPEIT
ncbi:trypsin-like peptidase domain-containing protein [Mesorhizobium sp. LjNodule214]|uniref:trypsin-like peptidase domain-containing protein n=1 Tax=Mesorhizobium sp. LjNodule214 TaxID=3342252 RepID=UPI003ED038EB